MTLTAYAPLYRTIRDFDRLAGGLAAGGAKANGQVAYDVARVDDDRYEVVLAVPGYTEEELDITVEKGTLVVRGTPSAEAKDVRYLHRGIARKSFERRFTLAEHVQVATARLEKGLLQIDLVREVPEALKPRRVTIGGTVPATGA